MGRKSFLPVLFAGLLAGIIAYAQQPVEVVESVIKVGIKTEEAVYYGFAEGDQLIFSFEEANGKEMKEIEIVEMPSTSRFMDYKTSKIENKTIHVPRKAIYKFRFENSALLPRVCKYKIQRIPSGPATRNFNTTVYFDTYYDTTYTTVMESYIDRSDTVISNLQDRVIKVNHLTAPGSSKSTFNFVLPENTVSWSYYISADKAGLQVYQEAAKELNSRSGSIIEKFPKYGPLAAVALNANSYLAKLDTGQHINYWIVEDDNAELFKSGEQFRFIKKGKVINDFSQMEPRDLVFYFCLHNDYKDTPVTVTVKITAILVNETLQTRTVQKMQVTPKKGMHLKN
jgi:hypothetical protein